MEPIIVQTLLNSDKKIGVTSFSSRLPKPKVVFKSYSQDQEFILPKNIDEFVGDGHISRLVSLIIDKMDIQFIIDTYESGGTSSYNPRMLLKTWILGFIYRVYSCRLIAKNLRENLAFIWISGNQTPDFRTLNNFRIRLKDDIKLIFKQIVLYGIETGIIKGEDVFIDHTKAEANANKHKIVWRKQVERQAKRIDEELDELFAHIDAVNDAEESVFGNKDLPEEERNEFDDAKVKEIIENINKDVMETKISREEGRNLRKNIRRIKELQIRKKEYLLKRDILGKRNSFSKTDHDAVAMMMKDKITVMPAYNEGIAVENGLVLNYVISDNCGDSVSFVPLMQGVIENLGESPENATSDSAYGNEENHSFLEGRKIKNFLKYNSYHNEKSKAWRNKKLRLEDFSYNDLRNEFVCKNGQVLTFLEERNEFSKTGFKQEVSIYRAQEGVCTLCPLRAKCTSAISARTLQVNWNAERLKEQARINLNSKMGKELRERRGNEVESIFGDQKLNKLKRRYHLRGFFKVNLEAGLYYISHNIRRMQKIIQNNKITRLKLEDKGKPRVDGNFHSCSANMNWTF